MEKQHKKKYLYPGYANSMLTIKGLYIYEWMIAIGGLSVCMFVFSYIGLVYGLMWIGFVYIVCVRGGESRQNHLMQVISIIQFSLSQKIYIRREREDIELQKEKEEKKKKRKKKENKPKKKKNKEKEKKMQDLFPFLEIRENKVYMEDGSVYAFLRLEANQLNFLNYAEVDALMESLGKDFDRNKVSISFFIQDSKFDIRKNINFVKKCSKESNVSFVSSLGNQIAEFMANGKKSTIKKNAYMRLFFKRGQFSEEQIEEGIARVKKVFEERLHPEDIEREEVKQIISIFASRMFSANLPDTELEFEENEKGLFVSKKETYRQKHMPGIYEFKDMICPVTAKFKPSNIEMGGYFEKVFAVSSIVASTEDTAILANIAELRGVTTSIWIETLPVAKYKAAARNSMKSKSASVTNNDIFDEEDLRFDRDNVKTSYRRLKENKQKMYYVSILFMITAQSMKDLEEMEDRLRDTCVEADVTLDPLETKQEAAWHSVHPLGTNKLDALIKQNIPSESVANLYPFSNNSFKDEHGLPIGRINDEKKDMVLFDLSKERDMNKHVLVLGSSGVGKTVLLWNLIQNNIITGGYTRNIDIQGTCIKFAEKLGGININMSGNNEFSINPLQIRVGDEVHAGIVDDYISVVKNWMGIYKSSWTGTQLDLFEHYLTETYAEKNITNETDLTKLRPEDYPLLSDVRARIQKAKEDYDERTSLGTLKDYNDLLLGMNSCTTGADAKLFNRYTYLGNRNFSEIQFINFDLHELMSASLDRKLAQWMNVFTYISFDVRENKDLSKYIQICIDELHMMLKKSYLPIVEIINEYERMFRKFNTSLIKCSQTMDEVNSDDDDMKAIINPLFNQPYIKFLFHMGDVDYKNVKQMLNLKDEEVAVLKKKREHRCLMRIGENVYDVDVMMPEWYKTVKADA